MSDPVAIDLLFGSDRERRALEADRDWRKLADSWLVEASAWRESAKPFIIYPG